MIREFFYFSGSSQQISLEDFHLSTAVEMLLSYLSFPTHTTGYLHQTSQEVFSKVCNMVLDHQGVILEGVHMQHRVV